MTKKYLSDFGFDPPTLTRALAPSEHRYTDGVPSEALRCALSLLDTRYPAHDMAEALNQIGAMIPAVGGGTFEGHPPGAIADALRRALEASRVEPTREQRIEEYWQEESQRPSLAKEIAESQKSRPAEPTRIAPWHDFKGGLIREGDEIAHPDGQHGKVIFLAEHTDPGDQWRVDYRDGCISRLCLQIGDKGQAVVTPNR